MRRETHGEYPFRSERKKLSPDSFLCQDGGFSVMVKTASTYAGGKQVISLGMGLRNFPGRPGLGRHPFTAVGIGSLPDCGTKIIHATCGAAKKTESKKKSRYGFVIV